MNKIKRLLFLAFLPLAFGACKKWDDHVKVTNQDLSQNLLQAIAGNSNLSKFRELVGKAGLDSLLQSSKTYTVWAPNNAALATLDPSIVNDTSKLRAFVLNHMSNQLNFTREAQTGVRIPMLSGKYNSFSTLRFDEALITSADRYVSNGVLHVIDKAVPVLPNLWEYISANSPQYSQNSYITGFTNYQIFDPSLATIDSISATTGLPVYTPGTGFVTRNRFTDRVYDTKREDKQYTYFLVNDANLVLEADSLKNYFKTTSTATTDSLTRWNTIKDLVIEGYYPTLPATVTSRSGVVVPLDPSAVVQTIKLSNAIVYVMSKVDVPTANKFREILIEGENPSGFPSDKRSNTNYRLRYNPATAKNYTDIMISGHGVTSYYAFYRLNETPSIKYKVYGLGVNDFQAATFTQNIVAKLLTPPSTYTTLATLAHAVPLSTAANAYNEMYLGEFTVTNFGTVEMQLTASGTNPLVLDYMRLVPVP